MLRFALPALGIYLADPLMSNIDNGFVGQFGGTVELAALGPGNVLANNFLYLFGAVLNSATTGLVARAWGAGSEKGAAAARKELSRTLSFAIASGLGLTAFYLTSAPYVLKLLGTPEAVVHSGAVYARIRGLSSFAVLAQGVCLSAILATRDSLTPLRVVLAAAALNFTGDWLLCAWPFRTGVAGAAWATTISVLLGFTLMLGVLRQKGLCPTLHLPRLKEAGPVLEYAGPMFIITSARVIGFTAMAITAGLMGTKALAAYQVIIGIFVFFAFVGAPLSQTAQSILPSLIDKGDSEGIKRAGRNIFTIASLVGWTVATLCFLLLRFGGGIFTADAEVIRIVAEAAPAVFLAVGTLLISSSVDGALLAAKDFGFVVPQQMIVCVLQLLLLQLVRRYSLGLPFVFLTFVMRLWVFITAAAVRVFVLRRGPLGSVLAGKA
eukprot:TRINITY_DN13549_c0_g2_i1.p1 TRINITY_DN13549_c0_g2~~TRINITY_DN13549_c0_g2_i1.p1  ORF type:complete len:437 (-),score=68.45 TRINITY_DN13549_c0_g2_i1:113-1423(-)